MATDQDRALGILLTACTVLAVTDAGEYCYYGYSTSTHYIYGFYYCYNSCCGYYSNRYCCSNSTATIVGAVIGGIICVAIIIAIIICCVMASKAKRVQRGHMVSPNNNISVVQYSNQRPQPMHAFPPPPPYREREPTVPPGLSNPASDARTGYSPPPQYSDLPPVYA